MFSSVFVYVAVCLSVCLLATLRKTFGTDLHEIFSEGWQRTDEQMFRVFRITALIQRLFSRFVTIGRYGK